MKKLCSVILVTLSLFTCQKADIGDIENLNGGRILLLGHAGLGFPDYSKPYPENSAISIERAIDGFNADGVEVDIQLSADSTIFLFHNAILESATDCQGYVQEYNSAKLQDCRYRENFSTNMYQNEHLYSLESMVRRYADYRDVYFLLDIKYYQEGIGSFEGNYNEALFGEIVRLTNKYSIADRLFVEVSSENDVKKLKALESKIRILYNIKNPSEDLSIAAESGADGIMVKNDRIDKAQVKQAHNLNLMVTLFSVESRQETIEAIEKHPDIILSDNIRLAQEVLMSK